MMPRMFEASDLALRRVAALLPARRGYALTRVVTPYLGGERRRWVSSVVRANALRLLGDERLATRTGERFAAELACDDLDAFTAIRWSEERRLGATTVVGADHLPRTGPCVVTSFHFSGGFRVFDVLRSEGHRVTFLHAPPRERPSGYAAAAHAARARYFERHLDPPFIEPGPGARDALDRHLAEGGTVVALLDVAPAALDLRDHAPCELFGRELRLPVGLLRLAARHGAPVVPYDGHIDADRRVLELHEPPTAATPEALLTRVLSVFERVTRARPWTWQGWLDVEGLFAPEA